MQYQNMDAASSGAAMVVIGLGVQVMRFSLRSATSMDWKSCGWWRDSHILCPKRGSVEPRGYAANHKNMKAILILCGLLALGNPAALHAEPPHDGKSSALSNAVILIIRHGEKPANGRGLTVVGQARANAYAGYFKNFTMDGQPLKLDCLFAAADSKASDRPRLTLEPTSKLLGLPINTPFEDLKFKELADEIRSKPLGKNILICWHHGEIPQLVHALGADPARLFPKGKWPDDIFNWVVELSYNSDGRLVAASRINQPF